VSLESVTEPETLEIFRPITKRHAPKRKNFGDFVIRVGHIAPTMSGLTWYDRMGSEGVHIVILPWPPEESPRTYEKARCGYNPRLQMTDFVNLPYIVEPLPAPAQATSK